MRLEKTFAALAAFFIALMLLMLLISWGGAPPTLRLMLHAGCVAIFLTSILSWAAGKQSDATHLGLLMPLGGIFLLIAATSFVARSASFITLTDVLLLVDAWLIFLSVAVLRTRLSSFTPQIKKILLFLLLGVAVYCFVAFFDPFFEGISISGKMNPNHIATLLLIPFFYLFVSGLNSTDDTHAKKKIRVEFLLLGAIALTFSRGGMLALLVAIAALAIAKRKAFSSTARWQLHFTLAMIVLGGVVVWLAVHFGIVKPSGKSFLFRSELLSVAHTMITQHPYFGAGLGSFSEMYLQLASIDTTHYRGYFAHNDFLQVFSELGLLGFSVVLVISALFVRLVTDASPKNMAVRTGLLFGIFAVFVHSFVDFGLHIPIVLLTFAVAAALSLPSKPQGADLPHTAKALTLFLTACLLVTPIVLLHNQKIGQLIFYPAAASKSVNDLLEDSRPADSLQLAAFFHNLNPSPSTYVQLGQQHVANGHIDAATTVFRQALVLDPRNSFLKEILARHLLEDGNITESFELFASVIATDSSRLTALIALAGQATNDLIAIERFVPEDDASRMTWIAYLNKHGHLPAALTEVQRLAENTSACEPHMALVRIAGRQNNWSLAEQALAKAKTVCPPQSATITHLSGDVERANQRYTQAIKHYLAAYETEPRTSKPLDKIDGLLQAHPALVNSVVKTIDQQIARMTYAVDLEFMRARIDHRTGNWKAAVDRMNKLTGRFPGHIGFRKFLGKLYFERKVYAQFFRIYGQIIEEDSSDIEPYLMLADAYLELKLDDQAKNVLAKAETAHPQNSSVRARLLRLQ